MTAIDRRGGYGEITREQGNREASGRIAQGLDRGAQEIPREGEVVHPAARRAEPPTARPALGEGRQAIRLRRAEGPGDAGGAFRRQEPARRLSLHVRPGLERGL